MDACLLPLSLQSTEALIAAAAAYQLPDQLQAVAGGGGLPMQQAVQLSQLLGRAQGLQLPPSPPEAAAAGGGRATATSQDSIAANEEDVMGALLALHASAPMVMPPSAAGEAAPLRGSR